MRLPPTTTTAPRPANMGCTGPGRSSTSAEPPNKAPSTCWSPPNHPGTHPRPPSAQRDEWKYHHHDRSDVVVGGKLRLPLADHQRTARLGDHPRTARQGQHAAPSAHGPIPADVVSPSESPITRWGD